MKKRIMVLGAGVYQAPLIRKAKQMGLETVVVSPKGRYPGIAMADIHLDLDTTHVKEVVKAAEAHAISGIVTSGTDVCLPSLGKVVDTLGLNGPGYDAALKSMDKVLMKDLFIKHNVPTASFKTFSQMQNAQRYAQEIGYPVMVKASDSSGSRGITKVSLETHFKSAWERAFTVSRSKKIIVEQFLDGEEFGAQAFILGSRVKAVFPHRDTVTEAPYFSPIGHSLPSRMTGLQKSKTRDVIHKAVSVLGLRDCVSNVDLMLVQGEPHIIEIGGRMGATCLPENISVYTGMDVYEYLILMSLGEQPELKVTDRQPNACLLLRSMKNGVVKAIDIPSHVRDHPDLIECQCDVRVGDPVRAFRVGPDRIGHIIVKGKTAEASEALAAQLASQVRIEVAD